MIFTQSFPTSAFSTTTLGSRQSCASSVGAECLAACSGSRGAPGIRRSVLLRRFHSLRLRFHWRSVSPAGRGQPRRRPLHVISHRASPTPASPHNFGLLLFHGRKRTMARNFQRGPNEIIPPDCCGRISVCHDFSSRSSSQSFGSAKDYSRDPEATRGRVYESRF